MRIPLRRRDAARRRSLSPFSDFLTLTALIIPTISALNFTPAPSPNLALDDLGSIAIAGDFSGISLYQFKEQTENSFNTNGSESLMARLPNGAFATVVRTDASIQAMCTFMLKNGTVAGVVIGGNFTSLGNLESKAIAMFNPNDGSVVPLAGLSGQVNALLCDQDTNTVFVGGNFRGADSTNAIAWVGDAGWTNLPFAGFNGPVTSITKASNGHIIFGGSFTGLGNVSSPSQPDGQIINLSTAQITSGSSTATQGFSDPKNIICKTSGADGSGNTWLLQDKTPGFWQASFNFGFQPSKLRLWNTHQDGRGTKTWRFTALPLDGIMNFTYIDPQTGQNASCTSECPLSSDASIKFQDFHFVNTVGMDAFRVDISDFYGNGGGLDGIELFENDVFAFAINDFNEPSCANLPFASKATPTGPWVVTPSHNSNSEYLTAQLAGNISVSSASIVFTPDIREAGNYSVNIYTPGCLQDGTCTSRAQVRITGNMATGTKSASSAFSTTIFQSNDYDKYDQIYFGYIDASSSAFRPTITMTPAPGQSLTNMTFVAQRIGLTLLNSTGGLTGLFEYDPSSAVVNTTDFTSSLFDTLGAGFDSGSAVNTLATSGDVTFVGGNFTSPNAKNIVAINPKATSTQALDGGLNGEVRSMFVNGSSLYVGGRFSGTLDNKTTGLNNVALFDSSKNSWTPLGDGVNGMVEDVVAMTMNVTSTTPELVIAFSGAFTQLRAFGNNSAISVTGFGVWVPSQSNWLQNLNFPVASLDGVLSNSILDLPGGVTIYAGSLSSSTLGSAGAVSFSSNGLGRLPVKIQPSTSASSSSQSKRDTAANGTLEGVITGEFYNNGGRNITVLGGHFTATATDGSTIHNLLLLDGTNQNSVTVSGLGSQINNDSTFVALALQGDNLFAGGTVTGTVGSAQVNGLISYNLASKSFNSQPPALSGGTPTSVNAITVRASTSDVYVGGSFTSAGSLGCPAVCYFSTAAGQWNQPGAIDGTVQAMMWISDNTLLVGGSLKINSSATSYLASYDANSKIWSAFPGSNQLPGPVQILTAGTSDGNQVWIAGTAANNGSVYLMKYDGSTWQTAGQTLGQGTTIRGLQVFSLTTSHDSTPLVDADEVLMLTGSLVLPGFGRASSALFNGTTFTPFALTTGEGNASGSIARIFTANQNFFSSSGGHMPLVFVVLIGLAISLGLMLLIVVAGLVLDRLRKKREGYVPAPTSMYDRGSGIQRIPPSELLESLGKGRPGAPHV